MKKKNSQRICLTLILAMTVFVMTAQNMSSYITLTVQYGSQVQLDLQAVAANTRVKIVSGTNESIVTVGDTYTGYNNYTAGASTMTIYGDITRLDCRGNTTKITGIVSNNGLLEYLICSSNKIETLDVSNSIGLQRLDCASNMLTALDVSSNTSLERLSCQKNLLTALDLSNNDVLKYLYCYDNNFTTQAIDYLFCSLPDRTGESAGKVEPLKSSTDPNSATIKAATASNAIDKNWAVKYYDYYTDITGFTGTYVCGSSASALTVSPSTLSMISEGEVKTINVTSNTSWTAVSSDSWLTLSATSGTNDGTLTATAEANTSVVSRTATVTFTAGSLTETVTVTQQGATATLIVSTSTLSMISEGEGKTINVTSNTSWTAVSSDSWLTLSATSGTNDGTLTATAEANTSVVSRTATVTFTAGSLTETVTVTQQGATATLIVSPSTLSMISEGEGKTINVTSNTSWTAFSSDSWLTLSATSGTNDGTLTATAEANTSVASRTATVTFTAGSLTETVTVTQQGATPTGIDFVVQENKLVLYPNPMGNILYVSSDIAVERISIYTTSGALVAETEGTDNINTSDLLPAIYIVKVKTAQGVTIEKVVKNKM